MAAPTDDKGTGRGQTANEPTRTRFKDLLSALDWIVGGSLVLLEVFVYRVRGSYVQRLRLSNASKALWKERLTLGLKIQGLGLKITS
ncbi:hypothetical protein EMCG_00289 [[Emmonsia] crescens]|uniref:Uncharacterized protein n=1 Tax=[Emmonsia] crescens TaxID=73230 RepID=A0A0G2J938_9EURO|nr:hypothetical protein EMCG_00289 [Emmonsia crescens UAMH 3008]